MPNPARLRQKLAALREAFAAHLPQRLATTNAACQAALDGPLDDAAVNDLCLIAHTLKGSAATYGYAALCETASSLEQAFTMLLGHAVSERSRFKEVIHELLAELTERSEEPGHAFDLSSVGGTIGLEDSVAPVHSERLVYLLDDDACLQTLVSIQLNHYGYQVIAFADGDKFRDAVIQCPPDAVIIDIALAGTERTGLDVLSALKQAMPKPPPAIVATSRTDLDARVGAVRAGAAGYLTKPVDATDLVAALDRLIWVETAEPFRILIVDDDAATASYHGEILRFVKMETRIVESPGAVMEQLAEFHPDLLLLDLYIPEISGADLAAVIRQQPGFASLPIVFLSTEQDPIKHLATIIGGADDFLTKPIHPDRLIASITARAQRARLLRSMTIQDPMTKLLNHTASKDHLSAELARAKRYNTSIAFALIDIDHFKQVNDTYGHPVGDAVIWGLARLLRQRLRQSDVVGRYGGEEFSIIMPETTIDQAVRVLEDLRTRFGALEFLAGEARFTMTFSGGVTLTRPTDQTADVIRVADEALYAAKRGGRNRIWAAPNSPRPLEGEYDRPATGADATGLR